MTYKFLSHTADVKFQAEGKTIEQAFSQAAGALKESICRDIKVKEKQKKEISVKGNDLEGLLYNFLEEFLFLLDAEDFLLAKIKDIKIDKQNFKLNATIVGDKASNYKFTNHVKAITYNEMFVKKQKNKWIVQVVVDV